MTDNKEGPFRHIPGGESLPACWPECPACAYAAGRKSIEEEVDAKIRAGKYMSLFQYEEKLRNEGYAAGVKAERERAAKIVDPAPGSVILCCSVDCGTKIAEILKKKAEAIRDSTGHWLLVGPSVSGFTYRDKVEADAFRDELNSAYAAGVKAERERITQKIIDMQFAFPGFANKTVDRIVESIRQEPA